MSSIQTSILTAAAAALFLTGSAFAATAFAAPAAGNAPYFSGVTTTSSQLQRRDVEAQTAAHLPATGEFSDHANVSQAASALTRARVKAAVDSMPAAGESA